MCNFEAGTPPLPLGSSLPSKDLQTMIERVWLRPYGVVYYYAYQYSQEYMRSTDLFYKTFEKNYG